jgi:hypothetical protein
VVSLPRHVLWCQRRTRTATAHKDVSRTGIEPLPDAYFMRSFFLRSWLRKTPKCPRSPKSEHARDHRNAAEGHHYSPAQGDRADKDDGGLGYWA